MWLANIFYWGCNQFITQRTLAARDVWHGRMGVVFAGFLKLLVPLLVVFPGIIAFRLYDASTGLLRDQFALAKGDLAFPTLVKQLLPVGINGLVMAGLLGAVMSHIASLLVSSSSIVTLDVYQRYFRRDATGPEVIRAGRWVALAVLIVATIAGFFLRDITGIFTFIQKYWSIAYPAICAVFLAGFFYRRASARGALTALIVGPVWALLFTAAENAGVVPKVAFLVRAGADFIFCCAMIWLLRTRGADLPVRATVDRTFTPEAAAIIDSVPWYKSFGFWSGVLLLTILALYVWFR
jgi:solute:Na+ symporter, SSS family